MKPRCFLAVLALVPRLLAQEPPPARPHGDRPGPWDNDVLVYRIVAGGAAEKLAAFERAVVPTVARLRDGRLIAAFQHFPADDNRNFDRVAVRFSDDEGTTWSKPEPIVVEGMEAGLARPFDPTLVPLPDGRVRLYFTSNRRPDFRQSAPAIYSAISTNGIHYAFEPGVRFALEGRVAIDCAVALHNGVFHLIVPDNGTAADLRAEEQRRESPRAGNGYHAVSRDGLKFERVADVSLPGRNRWLGNMQSDGGRLAFFGTGPGPWPVTSAGGVSWELAAEASRVPGADPGAVKLKDGHWLVIATSPPRPGTASVQQRGPRERGARAPGESNLPANAQPSEAPRGPRELSSTAESDFQPPRGRADNSPRESPGQFRLLTARSTDGLAFTPTGQIVTDQANVPDLIFNDHDEIFLYYTGWQVGDRQNTTALAISSDLGKSWRFKHLDLPGLEHAGDPDIVRLADGTFRLFLTTRVHDNMGIVFLDSPNGVRFERRGTAFAKDGVDLFDSTTFSLGNTWHMLTLEGRAVKQRHGTSANAGPFAFEEVMPFVADGEPCIAANGIEVNGGYRLFGFSPRKNYFRSFFSEDGLNWKVEEGVRLAFDERSSAGGSQIKDPSVLKLADGSYLMVYTARIGATHGEDIPDGVRREPDRPSASDGPRALPRNREALDARPRGGTMRVEKIESKYAVAPGAKPGSFVTGQDADILLGSMGFNNSGGPLLFNHPTGLATDGRALLMTDRWNNRVLIWKSAPATNSPPDLVLGQPDLTRNNPGPGRHQLNWPGNVAITPDGKRIAVTDTENNRILIWNSFPTNNGVAADLVLELSQLSVAGSASGNARPRDNPERRFPNRHENDPTQPNRAEPGLATPPESQRAGSEPRGPRPRPGGGMRLGWPWGVWTDGKKFAVVATRGGAVLIWNSFPAHDNQHPDLVLRPSDAGTPRNITSDGSTFFAVSDHNHGEHSRPATMVWRGFPTSSTQPPDFTWSEWLKGSFTADGRLVVGGLQSVYIWNQAPRQAVTDADVVLRPPTYRNGDGPDAVVANDRLYVCTYNGNHLLGWNSLPTRDHQPPDFSIGSDQTGQDTWAENYFIQNPVIATDGQSLFVSSDFDRKMFVWRNLPDANAAKPDLVFHLPEGPWDSELHGSTLVLAGRNTVYVWRKLPLNGEPPDATLSGSIGGKRLGEITGVAFDDKYFYLSDRRAGAIYVWEGIPRRDSEPKFTLSMRSPGRLNSDGKFLAAAPFEGQTIHLWRVSELSSRAEPIFLGTRGQFNLPGECLIADGRVFVANRGFNRVDVWSRVEDALAGRPADALVGADDEQDRQPAIGRNQLFMPGSVAWGGGYLWVGEFKFSTRILRFSPQARQSSRADGAGVRPSENPSGARAKDGL